MAHEPGWLLSTWSQVRFLPGGTPRTCAYGPPRISARTVKATLTATGDSNGESPELRISPTTSGRSQTMARHHSTSVLVVRTWRSWLNCGLGDVAGGEGSDG